MPHENYITRSPLPVMNGSLNQHHPLIQQVNGSAPDAGSLDYLEKCRMERQQDDLVRRLENHRIQEIISFCEQYNEMHDKKLMKDIPSSPNATYQKVPLSQSNGYHLDQVKKTYLTKIKVPVPSSARGNDSDSSSTMADSRAEAMISSSSSSSDETRKESSSSCETLNALILEGALLKGELEKIQTSGQDDKEDAELKEFRSMEREIKMSEIATCLKKIEDQIQKRNHLLSNCNRVRDVKVPLAQVEEDSSSEEEAVPEIILPSHHHEKPKGKASSLPPNEKYSVRDRAFDTRSLSRPMRRSVSYRGSRTQVKGLIHGATGLIKEMISLGHNLDAFSEQVNLTCCTCSGYLWKLCSKSHKKWKKRFFHFDRYHKKLFYYKSEDDFRKVKKPRSTITFTEIRDVCVDRTRSSQRFPELIPAGNDSKKRNSFITLLKKKPSESRFVFVVETLERKFILSTSSWELMRLWIDVIFTGADSYFD